MNSVFAKGLISCGGVLGAGCAVAIPLSFKNFENGRMAANTVQSVNSSHSSSIETSGSYNFLNLYSRIKKFWQSHQGGEFLK